MICPFIHPFIHAIPIHSLLTTVKFDADCYDRSKLSEYESTPYIPITLPSEEDVTKFTKRGVLIREAYEFIAKGSSIEECVKDLKLKQHKLTPYLTDTEKYWMMSVEGFGYKYNLEEGKKILDNFTFLDFKGPVRTSNVDNFFRVFIDHGRDNRNPGGVTRQVLFGRRICEGSRKAFNALTLKSRKYLGPTSTSADLALLMANQALVRPGTVSFDPFTGTGSILVACGYFGAYCFGTDIDWKTLHGKMRKATHTVVDNFKQYGLARPELMCSDNSIFPCNMKEFFDSIVCDPPYGVRAGAKKSGHVNGPKPKLDVSKFPSHFPASQHYPVEDVMDDLLDLAAKLLKVGAAWSFFSRLTINSTRASCPSTRVWSLWRPASKFFAPTSLGMWSPSRRPASTSLECRWLVEIAVTATPPASPASTRR